MTEQVCLLHFPLDCQQDWSPVNFWDTIKLDTKIRAHFFCLQLPSFPVVAEFSIVIVSKWLAKLKCISNGWIYDCSLMATMYLWKYVNSTALSHYRSKTKEIINSVTLAFSVLFCCFLGVEENSIFILVLVAVWSLLVTESSNFLPLILLSATFSPSQAVGIASNLFLPSLPCCCPLNQVPCFYSASVPLGAGRASRCSTSSQWTQETSVLLTFLGSSHWGTSLPLAIHFLETSVVWTFWRTGAAKIWSWYWAYKNQDMLGFTLPGLVCRLLYVVDGSLAKLSVCFRAQGTKTCLGYLT